MPTSTSTSNSPAQCAVVISILSLLSLIALLLVLTFKPPLDTGSNQLGILFSSPAVSTSSALCIVLFITAIISGVIAYRLVDRPEPSLIGIGPKILPEDLAAFSGLAKAFTDSDKSVAALDVIAETFLKLSSLRSWPGTFNYLGVSGLPLATIALTLVFTIMALLMDFTALRWGPTAKPDPFFDLAKLTLGAFIGSFVQKHVEQAAVQQSVVQQKRLDSGSEDPLSPPPAPPVAGPRPSPDQPGS
jgi:hypothetical protein